MDVITYQNVTDDACYMACLTGSTPSSSQSYGLTWICVTLLAVLLAFDFKLVPFSWTLSLAWHIVPNLKKTPFYKIAKSAANGQFSKRNPLFDTMSVRQRSSIGETDFNMHKSNSTFFADADISRGKLVFVLFSPAFRRTDDGNILRILEKDGHKGGLKFILSAVHASFRKEILPMQSYDVDSRIHSWDRKWLVVETCFWKRLEGKTAGKDLLCSVMSKIVIKKGRFTVEPQRMLRASGLITDECPVGDQGKISATVGANDEPGNMYYGWDSEKIEEQRKCGFASVQDWIAFSTKLTQIAA